MGCYFLLQRIFPTWGSNPGLPHCRQTLYYLSYQGSPFMKLHTCKIIFELSGHEKAQIPPSSIFSVGHPNIATVNRLWMNFSKQFGKKKSHRGFKTFLEVHKFAKVLLSPFPKFHFLLYFPVSMSFLCPLSITKCSDILGWSKISFLKVPVVHCAMGPCQFYMTSF